MNELSEIEEAYYTPIPQNEAEFQIYLREKAKAKERYCKRQRHLNAQSTRIGGVYVALCPDCKGEFNNHLLNVVKRNMDRFKVILK